MTYLVAWAAFVISVGYWHHKISKRARREEQIAALSAACEERAKPLGGFVSVRPRERKAFERGEAWHKAFAAHAIDLDTTVAANRALDLAFKAQQFDGEA